MTRPLAAILATAALAAAYAVARIHALGWHVDLGSVPVVVWAFLAGLLIRHRLAYLHGRIDQGAAHTFKAVGLGHWNLIRGKK